MGCGDAGGGRRFGREEQCCSQPPPPSLSCRPRKKKVGARPAGPKRSSSRGGRASSTPPCVPIPPPWLDRPAHGRVARRQRRTCQAWGARPTHRPTGSPLGRVPLSFTRRLSSHHTTVDTVRSYATNTPPHISTRETRAPPHSARWAAKRARSPSANQQKAGHAPCGRPRARCSRSRRCRPSRRSR